jgi:hypothetical protein
MPVPSPLHRPLPGSGARFIEEFDRCWPWLWASLLEQAFEHNGRKWPSHNRRHVFWRIARRQLFFWPFPNCAFCTEIKVSPTGLKTHVSWLAGGDLAEIVEKTPMIEDWGRALGCHRQVGFGRRGWLRALEGYSECGVYRQKSLIP